LKGKPKVIETFSLKTLVTIVVVVVAIVIACKNFDNLKTLDKVRS